MPRGGAPTGKWPTTSRALEGPAEPGDPKQVGAKLTVRRPDVPDVEIPLEKAEFVIGRQPDVDLTLDDELVSRRHARLTMDARGYFKLEDLGSRNGITYAGRNLRRLNLIDGDVFSIGKTEFTFHARMDRLKKPIAPPPREASVMLDIPIPAPELDQLSIVQIPVEPAPPPAGALADPAEAQPSSADPE
ncbi:FHA domain-containing protein [Myxococcota bacterium]|nr:FHA domain-containing protein [Myxococcota bacterium]